jgi:hypothetical protein
MLKQKIASLLLILMVIEFAVDGGKKQRETPMSSKILGWPNAGALVTAHRGESF